MRVLFDTEQSPVAKQALKLGLLDDIVVGKFEARDYLDRLFEGYLDN